MADNTVKQEDRYQTEGSVVKFTTPISRSLWDEVDGKKVYRLNADGSKQKQTAIVSGHVDFARIPAEYVYEGCMRWLTANGLKARMWEEVGNDTDVSLDWEDCTSQAASALKKAYDSERASGQSAKLKVINSIDALIAGGASVDEIRAWLEAHKK